MGNELIGKLYKQYGNALLVYIYSICRDFGMAEELAQDTFVKALLSLDKTHGNFKAWLFMVGRNLTYNKMKRHNRVVLKDEIEEKQNEESVLSELIKNEKNRELYESLLSLPQNMKQVLILHYFSELSFTEIGRIMDISPGNARNLAYKARMLLKKELEVNHGV